jgi:membrane-bound inhibitor of C-type lysozyme
VGARLRLLMLPITPLFALAPVALLAQEPPAPPSPPATPGAPATPALPDAPPAPAMKRAIEWKQFRYTCEDGAKLQVYLHNETAKVEYKGEVYLMRQTGSADGVRYSDGKVLWWSKGYGGFLQEETPDGNGEMIVKGCEEEKPPLSPEAKRGTLSGTVSYRLRLGLPPSAVIEVALQDGSADSAIVIAKQEITLGDRQPPVLFELRFDPAKIDTRHTYFVSARILVDGDPRFSGKAVALAGGMLGHPEVIVQPKTWTIAPTKP